jgi:SAM-dependent methyltransferase
MTRDATGDKNRAIDDRQDRRRLDLDQVDQPLDPYVTSVRQERERALIRWARSWDWTPASALRVLEIGCGSGDTLLDLVRIGFEPRNLMGIELRPEQAARARQRLPAEVLIVTGDAARVELQDRSFDAVLQFTVFNSILDGDFQERLARRMWNLARPGGGILWYDLVRDDPRNPEVRGVPLERIRRLFPGAKLRRWSVTLAPQIGRRLCRISPALYPVADPFPFLKTHVLCWIQKT